MKTVRSIVQLGDEGPLQAFLEGRNGQPHDFLGHHLGPGGLTITAYRPLAKSVRARLADDSVLLREGLQLLLAEAGHEVVAAVGDGPAAVAAVLDHRPDLALLDVRMPPSHTDEGLRAAVEVRRHWPGACLLVLSQYVKGSYADELLASDPVLVTARHTNVEVRRNLARLLAGGALDEARQRAQVLSVLAKYPLLEGPSVRGDENIDVATVDVDRLKEYVEEVKEWMSLMRALLYRPLWGDVR